MTLALYISSNNTMCWYRNNERHNKFGPTIKHTNGSKYWYINGKKHRLNGPAVEKNTGVKQWYINNIKYDTYLEYIVAVNEYKRSKETYGN